ncbi:MAG: hypothetical protein AAFU64_12290, partial [Bacteroidota bacterium]
RTIPVNAQLQGVYYWTFIEGQLGAMQWIAAPLWLLGLFYLLFSRQGKTLRFFGWFFFIVFFLLLFLKAKHYYLFGVYPFLLAAGAYAYESRLSKRYQYYLYAYLPLIWIMGMLSMPNGTPFLPIETYLEYSGLAETKESNGRVTGLSSDYADMFGWEKQVDQVLRIYQSLDTQEQEVCIIWADNYGEAGAINYFGSRQGLPPATSRHGSFYLWGPGEASGQVAITLGIENKEWIASYYQEIIEVDHIFHPYAVDEEVNVPIYLCRKPRRLLKDHWAALRPYVFD